MNRSIPITEMPLTRWDVVRSRVRLFCAVFRLGLLAASFVCRRAASGVLTMEWGRAGCRCLHLKGTLESGSKLRPGTLIVGNHQCYTDIVLHAAHFPIRFVSKAEVRENPVLWFLIRKGDPLLIDRTKRRDSQGLCSAIADSLKEGKDVMIYPEGTTGPGDPLLPFKTTGFAAAMETGAPVRFLVTCYEACDGKYNPAWYGNLDISRHILCFFTLKECRCKMFLSEEIFPEPGQDRKAFAEMVRDRMMQKRQEMQS